MRSRTGATARLRHEPSARYRRSRVRHWPALRCDAPLRASVSAVGRVVGRLARTAGAVGDLWRQADAHEVRDGVQDVTLPTEERAVVVSILRRRRPPPPGRVGDHVVGGEPDDVVPSGRGRSQVKGVGGPPGEKVDEDEPAHAQVHTDPSTMRCNVGR